MLHNTNRSDCYKKVVMAGTDRKAVLIGQLTDHVLAHGLGGASLRPLAAAVGTSDRMLLYYFPDKPALIAAVLQEVAARMTVLLDLQRAEQPVAPASLEARMLPLVLDPAVWPYMQLWLEMAALAARGDQVCAAVGNAIALGFIEWLEGQLDIRDAADRSSAALQLLMKIEGAVLLKSLGLFTPEPRVL
jgi:AcrR family transcriptional regulator